jgi:hypothetical protein
MWNGNRFKTNTDHAFVITILIPVALMPAELPNAALNGNREEAVVLTQVRSDTFRIISKRRGFGPGADSNRTSTSTTTTIETASDDVSEVLSLGAMSAQPVGMAINSQTQQMFSSGFDLRYGVTDLCHKPFGVTSVASWNCGAADEIQGTMPTFARQFASQRDCSQADQIESVQFCQISTENTSGDSNIWMKRKRSLDNASFIDLSGIKNSRPRRNGEDLLSMQFGDGELRLALSDIHTISNALPSLNQPVKQSQTDLMAMWDSVFEGSPIRRFKSTIQNHGPVLQELLNRTAQSLSKTVQFKNSRAV